MTVYVRMLGNVENLENGKTYPVPVEKANQLTGLGQAVIVDKPAEKAKED